jgi:hypothetical protein
VAIGQFAAERRQKEKGRDEYGGVTTLRRRRGDMEQDEKYQLFSENYR